MKKGLKVYLADDHTLFRKAMVSLLLSFSRVSDVMDVENGKELLGLVKNDIPDVVIVDLQMPVMDGVETCEQLLAKFPDVKIIVLTMHNSDRYILHMMELGVHAFLLKNTDPTEFEKAIYAVFDKDFYHNDLVATVLRKSVRDHIVPNRPDFKHVGLTEREKEIVVLICNELTIREIAAKLFLSENTVRNHRANIMEKIGVHNMVGMVKFAYDSGLIS